MKRLRDRRILIIGGDDANGPVQSVEIFGTNGVISSAAAMNIARSHHFAIALSDGRVLVGGGTSGGGTTNSAEIYNPANDSWTQASPMVEARANATTALLQDGRVVIADDLLATGGTSLATVHLAEKLGAQVTALSFVIELEALKGRKRLAGYNVVSLLKY